MKHTTSNLQSAQEETFKHQLERSQKRVTEYGDILLQSPDSESIRETYATAQWEVKYWNQVVNYGVIPEGSYPKTFGRPLAYMVEELTNHMKYGHSFENVCRTKAIKSVLFYMLSFLSQEERDSLVIKVTSFL